MKTEVAQLRGILATLLKVLPSDQHAQRARLLSALSELQMFEHAFVEHTTTFTGTGDTPVQPPKAHSSTEKEQAGRTKAHVDALMSSLEATKREVAEILAECEALRRALRTEQQCHKDTVHEITVAWNELNAVLDREERKNTALTVERDALRAALQSPEQAASPHLRAIQEKRDELAVALQECEAAICRVERERDALADSLEKHKTEAAAVVKDREDQLARVEAERDALLTSRKSNGTASAALGETERKKLTSEIEAAQVKIVQLEIERDGLSSTLDTVTRDLTSRDAALETLQQAATQQTKTIEEAAKKRRELESSLAVAEILKSQVAGEVKNLTDRCTKLTTSLETSQAENTALHAELVEAQGRLASETAALGNRQARLLVAREHSDALKTRVAKMEKTLEATFDQQRLLLKVTAERDMHAQRLQDALDALDKQRQARAKAEDERNAMVSELREVKARLVEVVRQNTPSHEHLNATTPYLLPSYQLPQQKRAMSFALGTSSNKPGASLRSPVKSPSRFGSHAKAAGGTATS